MSAQVFDNVLSHAIGGGWGSEEPFQDCTRVIVIRGADFPAAALQSLNGAPARFEATKKVETRALRNVRDFGACVV